MEQLANSFSVLELDADDSNVQPLSPPTTSGTPFTFSSSNHHLFIYLLLSENFLISMHSC